MPKIFFLFCLGSFASINMQDNHHFFQSLQFHVNISTAVLRIEEVFVYFMRKDNTFCGKGEGQKLTYKKETSIFIPLEKLIHFNND